MKGECGKYDKASVHEVRTAMLHSSLLCVAARCSREFGLEAQISSEQLTSSKMARVVSMLNGEDEWDDAPLTGVV